MLVYLINIALIVFWGVVLLKYKPTEKKKKIYCGIVALQWILISGLRSPYMSADIYINYYRYFKDVKTTSWAEIFNNIFKYMSNLGNNNTGIDDPGYALFVKLCQIFSDNFQVFLLLVAIAFTVPMAIWIYKNSEAPDLSFVLYSSLFYSFFALTGLRQTIATAIIVFCGYNFIKNKKYVKFALLAFVAFLVHKSAISFIPFCFIANISFSWIYLAIAVIFIVGFFLFGDAIYVPIVQFIGYEDNLLSNNQANASVYALLMLCICFLIIVFFPMINRRRPDAKNWFNLLLLSILTILLVFQAQEFMRIQQYFTLSFMILLPELVMCINKKYRNIVHYAAIAFMTMYLIYNHPTYMFFWQ